MAAQSAKINIVEETDPKPRKFSFQGGEDDTDVDASDVEGSIQRNIYAPNYFQLSEDGAVDKSLNNHSCSILSACNYGVFLDLVPGDKKRTELYGNGKLQREYYLHGSHRSLSRAYSGHKVVRMDEFTREYSNRRYRGVVRWFKRKSMQFRFLYLFLPGKETYQGGTCRRCSAWSLLSLKEIGWGPPAMQSEKTHEPTTELVSFYV